MRQIHPPTRILVPIVTSEAMPGGGLEDVEEVGRIMVEALADDADLESLAGRASALSERHPLYPAFRGYCTYSPRPPRAKG